MIFANGFVNFKEPKFNKTIPEKLTDFKHSYQEKIKRVKDALKSGHDE